VYTLYVRKLRRPPCKDRSAAWEVILVVLLFGPPGCGKGTQAGALACRFGIPAISTGEMFRAECKAGTDLGRKASSILAAGGLVGDDIVNAMVARRIARSDCAQGFLLDGYPRTVPQAQFFARVLYRRGLAKPLIIHLDVPEELLVTRLGARRQCPRCLRIYNLLSQPPRREGQCDHDNAGLITRDDDQPAVIRQRLRAYEALTDPILDWYGPSAVYRIDGAQVPAAVTGAIERVLLQNRGLRVASAGMRVAEA
jgi:adenylate kinase